MRSEAVNNLQKKPLQAFGDRRIFLISRDEPEASLFLPADQSVVSQHCDGPIYVTIGEKASDTSLEEISTLYDVPIEALVKFRDTIAL